MKYLHYNKTILKKVNKILISSKTYYWTGNKGIYLKKNSQYSRNKYSVAVSNGNIALEIAQRHLNLINNQILIITNISGKLIKI